MWKEKLLPRWLLPGALGALAFCAYLFALPHTTSFEDSAEFTAAAATFGLPHPSGYPLYVLLAHLFSRLPFGTVPWRVALFSAVCATAALVMLFLAARRVLESVQAMAASAWQEAAAGLVLLQLGVSVTWYSQAVMAEVYALHAAGIAAITLALTSRMPALRRALTVSFLFGLACSDHLYLAATAAPALMVALLWQDPAPFKKVRTWILCLVAFALGLTPYALIPAFSHGGYVYWPMRTAGAVFDMVTRRSYGDVGEGGFNKYAFIFGYGGQLLRELLPLTAVAACYGAWRTWRKGERLMRGLLLWLLGPLLSVPIVALVYTADFSSQGAYIYKVYALGGLAVVAMAGAVGMSLVVGRFGWRAGTAALVLLVLAVQLTFMGGRAEIAAFADPFPSDYARAVLASLPPDAVLVALDERISRDTLLFGFSYLQSVEKFRTDVTVVNDAIDKPLYWPGLPSTFLHMDTVEQRVAILEVVRADKKLEGRPLYATFPAEPLKNGMSSRTNGLAYALTVGPRLAEPLAPAALPPEPLPELAEQYALGSLFSHYLFTKAAYESDAEGAKEVLPTLLRALELDKVPFSREYQDFQIYRAAGLRP